jgi:hypothetical protein
MSALTHAILALASWQKVALLAILALGGAVKAVTGVGMPLNGGPARRAVSLTRRPRSVC